ncbi:hypothetical protein QR680_000158 [Steinernema hermaphroditum]|uniref:Histone deacetylase domain-containing protein n=1 Tax=Steinernema hermaphroditum TaxID=289476 RepID=A0AA39LDN7_9BILA|nr:hypothetical protein QR680_000158 [Steinernema hermaphroditum]
MSKKFGFVYDERMLAHECLYDDFVYERPERARLIYERLRDEGLLDDAVKISARRATDDEITLAHPKSIIEELDSLKSLDECEDFCRSKEILWLNPKSAEVARLAVGSAVDIVKANVEKKIGNGFAIVRPPGHHSYDDLPQGYCVYNNVAIAAKYAVEVLGVKRLMVVDFDVHAGNGSFNVLKDDDRILFVSSHLHHYGAFWPHEREFDCDVTGNNIFIPFNGAMNSEGDYLAAYHHVVLPIARQFKPEMVICSAGFDAGYFDVMLEDGQGIKAPGYGHLIRLLNDLCPDRVIAIFEGGYFPKNYVESAYMMTRGLRHMSLPKIVYPKKVNGSMCEVIWDCLSHHAKRWTVIAEALEKAQKQQELLGLAKYAPRPTKLFLGDSFREHINEARDEGRLNTRNWIPVLTDDQVIRANTMIEAYIKEYNFYSPTVELSAEELVQQIVWDEKTQADCHVRNVICMKFYNEWMDYLQDDNGCMFILNKKNKATK